MLGLGIGCGCAIVFRRVKKQEIDHRPPASGISIISVAPRLELEEPALPICHASFIRIPAQSFTSLWPPLQSQRNVIVHNPWRVPEISDTKRGRDLYWILYL